jgi:mycothiol synthase
MQTWCLAADAVSRRLLEHHGFDEVRRFYRMLIELKEPPAEPDWPDGVRVGTFRPEDARVVYDTLNETFKEEWNFVPEPYERWRERRLTAPDFDPTLWFLARDGDELVAVARCDRSRFGAGWVGALGVRKPWRRRGLGLALLRHLFADFYRRGETRVALGVDAQNSTGATRLYERAGMHVAYEASGYAKELR